MTGFLGSGIVSVGGGRGLRRGGDFARVMGGLGGFANGFGDNLLGRVVIW